jgi:hypothetical protein
MTRSLRAALLDPLRRGGRPVAWTPPFMGSGNVLLVALWAHEETLAGRPSLALATDAIRSWFDTFPSLRSVLVERESVRFTDRRVMPWSSAHQASRSTGAPDEPMPIDMAAVGRFLDQVLLPDSPVVTPGFPDADPDRLVINVRRGDYYSDPDVRGQYGFDLEPYLRLAVEASCSADGPPSTIVVVSDGMDWCRARLGWLDEVAPVEFAAPTGAVGDFLRVAASRRIVLTNSTFSYWAAYVSNAVRGDNHQQVWAPRFFDRSRDGGRSWLLDERWSVVESIPGGWDS